MTTAIIIPCYNEEKRLNFNKIINLSNLLGPDNHIYLVNDGSTDDTAELITKFLKEEKSKRIFFLNFKTNEGKAEVIRKSIFKLKELPYEIVGYFDADFSTPAEEMLNLYNEMLSHNYLFCIASRVQLLNSGIERKPIRHIIGRIVITIINFKEKLGIYDTQCGAKFFKKNILIQVLDKPFYTSWLFDIEIFLRLRKLNFLSLGKELPINNWKDIDGSKLSWKSAFQIINQIYIIFKKY